MKQENHLGGGFLVEPGKITLLFSESGNVANLPAGKKVKIPIP